MAIRRMFSKTITNSSRFLMMPQSSQNLYFHLGMNADDDGFCEHFTIMRMTESKPDDLKVLQAKGFIQVFDDKVLVILDWKENNYLRNDRYTPSKYLKIYKEELSELSRSEDTSGIPAGYQRDTQVRIGKVRKGNKLSAKADGSPIRNLEEFIIWCKKSTQRHIHIIADYADEKKISHETKDQWQQFIKRNLRPARSLSPYSDKQIGEAMRKLNEAKKDYLTDWTLETLNKFLDK